MPSGTVRVRPFLGENEGRMHVLVLSAAAAAAPHAPIAARHRPPRAPLRPFAARHRAFIFFCVSRAGQDVVNWDVRVEPRFVAPSSYGSRKKL